MNRTVGVLGVLYLLAAAGLAIGVAVERRAGRRLALENRAWRQQLGAMDGLLAENRRLSNLVAQACAPPVRANPGLEAVYPADERPSESTRLRHELGLLHQQSKEIETLREDTRRVRAALDRRPQGQAAASAPGSQIAAEGSGFEILQAEYGTAHTNLDVAAELRDRIRGGKLKAVAGNRLKDDPEFGQLKHLTVVYRFGGATRTNQYREGDLVILPEQ